MPELKILIFQYVIDYKFSNGKKRQQQKQNKKDKKAHLKTLDRLFKTKCTNYLN